MDRNFYTNDDFEEFLKQKADQYKMYPSDRVWKNIYSSLHSRKRWLIFGFTLLFLGSSLFIGNQTVVSNYTRMVTRINKTPEVPFTASAIPSGDVSKPLSTLYHKSASPIANPPLAFTDAAGAVADNNPRTPLLPPPAVTASAGKLEGQVSVIENNIAAFPAASVQQTPAAVFLTSRSPASRTKVIQNVAKPAINPTALVQHDAVANALKPSRWSLQLYASPVLSYRRLSSIDNGHDFTAPVLTGFGDNINQYVHHKPAPGLEAGGRIQYQLSRSLSVYAGAQLNYSRYYIDAYRFHVEKASIALSDSRLDTLSGYTDIRNFAGYAPEQLQNQYWQLSVPIGIQIKLLGERKLQLNVAGGVQPTFLISSQSYLLSSDYKNYIQRPDLARNFNIHTNFEAFISYQTGGIKWQLGPQFRSQLLSSYSNQYRVREYLTEVGIKFGVTKSLK